MSDNDIKYLSFDPVFAIWCQLLNVINLLALGTRLKMTAKQSLTLTLPKWSGSADFTEIIPDLLQQVESESR